MDQEESRPRAAQPHDEAGADAAPSSAFLLSTESQAEAPEPSAESSDADAQTLPRAMSEAEWKQLQLARVDEAKFAARAARAGRTRVHGIIPQHFFSAASSECRELFIDGHFYGCISLAQAVAEGLTRYLGDFHKVGARKDSPLRASKLHKAGAISGESHEAFKVICGNDRNTFHHLNESIPTDYAELEARAEQCVNALYTIESEVFAYETGEGGIKPKNPQYWPWSDPNHVTTYLRLGGH